MPPIIPLRYFYANSASRWNHQLSPDGKRIAWLESKYLKPALWVQNLDGDESEIFHTSDTVRWYRWSANGRYLIYQADRDGWENDVIVSIDTTQPGAEPRSYSFGKDVKSWINRVPGNGGSKILIQHNGRNPAVFDLYRLNLDSGETELLEQAGNIATGWQTTPEGRIYGRSHQLENGRWRFQLKQADGTYRQLVEGGIEDRFWSVAAPDADGTMLAVSNFGRDKSALVKLNTGDLSVEVVDEHAKVDYGWIVQDPKTARPLYARLYPGYPEYSWFDDDLKARLEPLLGSDPSNLFIRSMTRDLSKILVGVHEDTKGSRTILVDRNRKDQPVIDRAEIEQFSDRFSKVEPVQIKARDGLMIPAFLSRAKGVTGPGPMVIIIHGGPVARSYWGYSDLRGMLNNRGYAVLDVNYRMSDGYGRAFREAGIGEISRKADDDIADARQWAVDQGIADPKAVGVFGGSFGGLKVLTALTRSPDLYAAGVDINGISDLESMYREVPVYWRGWPAWYQRYIGDVTNPEHLKDIRDRSPLTHAKNLKAPLLIIQGANDVRVIRDQSDKMFAALNRAQKPVDYVLLDGAGHQANNWKWQDRIRMMRRIERFFARHLGGRAHGYDYAVLGASIIPK